MRTDRQTDMTKLTAVSRNFANGTKISYFCKKQSIILSEPNISTNEINMFKGLFRDSEKITIITE